MPKTMCSVEGCENASRARGWCKKHYQRWAKYGDPTALYSQPRCEVVVEGQVCGRPLMARRMCSRHYARWKRLGDPLGSTRPVTPNCYVEEDGVVCGRTCRKGGNGMCPMHYQRVRNGGSVDLRIAKKGAPRRWLEDAVANRDRSSCWMDWPYATKSKPGCPVYPVIGRHAAGHLALELDGRPRPGDGVEMCHAPTCEGSMCLNPDDLRWDTRTENMKDRTRAGWTRGRMLPQTKLTEDAVRTIRADHAAGVTEAALARRYGVTHGTVSAVLRGLSWAHVK